jgi:hypothetical protein
MRQLAYKKISSPHRVLIVAAILCVLGLMAVMMARTIELHTSKITVPPVVEEEDEKPRIPLPAGPRRFQEPRR